MSKTTTIARMRRSGGLVRIKPDGTEEALDAPPLAPPSAAEIEAAARRDHENPPLTAAHYSNESTPHSYSNATRVILTRTVSCAKMDG
jgi:hypothetical protein